MTIALASDHVDLPDGTYRGTWSAYTISIANHPGIHLETVDGNRSLSGQTVSVVVSGGRAVVWEGA